METPDTDLKVALLGSPSVDDDCRHADGSRRTGSSPSSDLDDGTSRRSTTTGAADGAAPPSPPPLRATAGTRSGVAGVSAGYLTDGEPGVAEGRRTDHDGGDNLATSKRKSELTTVHSFSLDADVFVTQSGKHRSADSPASDDSLRSEKSPRDVTQAVGRRSYTILTPEEKIELKHLREELNLLLKQYKRESELLPVSVLRESQQSPPSIDFSAVRKPLSEKAYLVQAVEKARKKIQLVRQQTELSSGSETDPSADDSSCITDTDGMLSQLYGITATKEYQTKLMPSFGKERATIELELQRLRYENQDLRYQLDVRLNALEHDLRYLRDRRERKEREREDTQIRKLEGRMRRLEAQSRKPRNVWYKSNDLGDHAVVGNSSVGCYSNPRSLANLNYVRKAQPISSTLIQSGSSQTAHGSARERVRFKTGTSTNFSNSSCFICRSLDHYMANCPKAICGNCRQRGHTRSRCNAAENVIPREARFIGGQLGHRRQECLQLRRYGAAENRGTGRQFRAAVATTKMGLCEESTTGNLVHLQMACVDSKPDFILDSGGDFMLLPNRYLRRARTVSTARSVVAPDAAEKRQ